MKVAVLLVVLVACVGMAAANHEGFFLAEVSSANVPAPGIGGSGSFILSLEEGNRQATLHGTHSVPSSVGGFSIQVHQGSELSATGPVIIDFGSVGASPVEAVFQFPTEDVEDETFETAWNALFAGNAFIVVTTSRSASGTLRGQLAESIRAPSDVSSVAILDLDSGIPRNPAFLDLESSGTAKLSYDDHRLTWSVGVKNFNVVTATLKAGGVATSNDDAAVYLNFPVDEERQSVTGGTFIINEPTLRLLLSDGLFVQLDGTITERNGDVTEEIPATIRGQTAVVTSSASTLIASFSVALIALVALLF